MCWYQHRRHHESNNLHNFALAIPLFYLTFTYFCLPGCQPFHSTYCTRYIIFDGEFNFVACWIYLDPFTAEDTIIWCSHGIIHFIICLLLLLCISAVHVNALILKGFGQLTG